MPPADGEAVLEAAFEQAALPVGVAFVADAAELGFGAGGATAAAVEAAGATSFAVAA